MRSGWVSDDVMGHLLAALTPPNRLACEMSLRYGMRIGDVLNIKTEQLHSEKLSYREEKTGKRRVVHVSAQLRLRLLSQAGRLYVFEHRTDPLRHRTRQAVWKDLKRVAYVYRLKDVSVHSCRKGYAVRRYRECGDLRRVKQLLNHSDEAVTMLYAMADVLSKRVEKSFTRFSHNYHTAIT